MTIYNKTAWKDHIVDSGGAVVQQGTPLSAGNLNRIEEGLANATAMLPGELGAAIAHSGVLDHVANATTTSQATAAGQVYLNGGIDWANTFGVRAFQSLIAGSVIPLPTTGINKILLPAPPSEGTRDDLVFLEAWRDQSTQAWQTRIRIASGVDFSKYSLDGFYVTGTSWANVNRTVTGQGGNTAPLAQNTSSSMSDSGAFVPAGVSSAFNTNYPNTDDQGLYITGNGSATSKASLKTYDGYVYAIPLFKVNRRNSGGYSTNNPNGARDFYQVLTTTLPSTSGSFNPKEVRQVSVPSTTGMRVGDVLTRVGSPSFTLDVVSIESATLVTVKESSNNTGSFQVGVTGQTWTLSKSDRPDGLYANIIDERDITDLRHKTYLVAPSYEQLLIDGTDQILRGASQVERKKAMRKTYVGVRKTPLDANHVFYASLDGTLTAEIGGKLSLGSGIFQPGATGGAYQFNLDSVNPVALGGVLSPNVGTVEFFLKKQGKGTTTEGILELETTEGKRAFALLCRQDETIQVVAFTSTTSDDQNPAVFVPLPLGPLLHIRVTWELNVGIMVYVNGKLTGQGTYNTPMLPPSKILLGAVRQQNPGAGISFQASNKFTVSDVVVSSVNRGASFATLPADFIAGYADITAALSDQRRINSDAQTSQKSYAAAKVKNQPQERCITVTKGTGTNTAAWEAGDKIKLKGLAGEIIGGIIDADTALAKVTGFTDATHITVDDVSKLAVNDTFTVVYSTGTSGQKTITGIDVATKTLTITPYTDIAILGGTLYETTASSSSPVVRAIIAGTSTVVPGTWANLGTNEAEVTMGVLPGGLVAQDIIIEYSLNMPAGQGSLYQVFTKTLVGEANGKKLITGTVAITDDFAGKVAGSTTANPHKAYSAVGSALATPSAPGTEFAQADYDAVKLQDNSLKVTTTSVPGQQAQVLISVDIIRAFEDKYGKIPGAYTLAEKVAWLKANTGINYSIWVYGAGSSGNKATLSYYESGTWATPIGGMINTGNTVARLTRSLSLVNAIIQPDGLAHAIVYAESSDGTTASTLYLDHFSVEFYLYPVKTGYDLLVPENPRRDAGLAGVLYVRRQTREVESLFPGNDEDNGIVVIGDYLPTQDYTTVMNPAALAGAVDVLLSQQGFVTTAGTNKAYGDSNSYANAIARLMGPGSDLNYKVDPQSLVSTQTFEGSFSSGAMRYWYIEAPYSTGLAAAAYTDGIPNWAKSITEFLGGYPALVQYNGELLLRIAFRPRSTLGPVGIGGTTSIVTFYRLPGRPLVKI
ncbi:hypothetical protein M2444_002320 [Paenibacillus sp. PastF-3]|uniref:hypothetical protein n=1 Tax=Paenibacillus sp. PastF-3 TaxID=2940626 RepID=UPI0024745EA5|nr:hypothetical protein [Paenibacillus sp. PastF-3]MDH6370540.1 hypothetical protein [Paenibacillus sp. PastF-3]